MEGAAERKEGGQEGQVDANEFLKQDVDKEGEQLQRQPEIEGI
jgi:hypothetical protein